MREFIGLMTFDYDDTGVYRIINEVYSTVIAMNPQQSIQNIIYLIVFLLCHCTPDKTIILTLYLLDLKEQVENGTETLLNCLKTFPFSNNELTIITKYVNYRIDKYFNAFLVNGTNFEGILYLITKIIERRSCEEIFYFFTSHIFTLKGVILKTCQNYILCDYYMIR